MITEGFIDGDLVERFLDFSQTQMEEVCRGLKVPRVMMLLFTGDIKIILLHKP